MEDKKRQELRSFEWKSDPSAPVIYGNYHHVSWTLEDLTITLGTLKAENVNSKQYFALERGSVTLGWREAKSLAAALTRIVTDYEQKNGEIATPYLADPDKAKVN